MKKFMLKCGASIVTCLCIFAPITGKSAYSNPGVNVISGYVFEDINLNESKEPNDPPLVNAVVSDGFSVVTTDKTGRYELTLKETPHRVVFLSMPSGYRASKYGSHYHYIKGQQAEYSFAVSKVSPRQTESLTFVQYTDPHMGKKTTVETIAKFRREIEEEIKPDILMITGDLVNGAKSGSAAKEMFNTYLEEHRQYKIPVYECMGNHDVFHHIPKTEPESEKGAYQMLIGPTYYSFNYAGVHFVCLDTMPLNENQLTWFEKELSYVPPGTPLVFLIHVPVFEMEKSKSLFEKFIDAAREHKILAVLSGHTAASVERHPQGFPMIVTSAVYHGNSGYRIGIIRDGQFFSFHKTWGKTDYLDIDIIHPGPGGRGESPLSGRVSITAKYFNPNNINLNCEIRINEKPIEATLISTSYWSQWEAQLDTTTWKDGIYALSVRVNQKERKRNLIIDNQKSFKANSNATLKFEVVRIPGSIQIPVKWNDEKLYVLSGKMGGEEVTIEIPAEKIRRLNRIEFVMQKRMEHNQRPLLSDMALIYGSQKLRAKHGINAREIESGDISLVEKTDPSRRISNFYYLVVP